MAQPQSVRSFVWAPMSEFGETVKHLDEEITDIPAADFIAGPAKFDIPGDFRFNEFGLLTDGKRLVSGQPRLIRLKNASVQRSSLGGHRYHVVLMDGVCAQDAYHHGPWIGPMIAETFRAGTYKGPVVVNFMDDVGAGATIEEPHVLISAQWQDNYAHTIHESLSRWWCLDSYEKLPKIWEIRTSPQKQLAEMFHAGEHFVTMPAERTRYATLYVPSFRAPYCVSKGQVDYLRQALANEIPPATTRKLYISRADTGTRRVLNEPDLAKVLIPMGFEGVMLAGKSIAEQIALFKGAEIVVAPHGSALVNLLFMASGTRLLELVPKSYQHPMYWYMAKWAGLSYGRIVCPDNNPATQDFAVDPLHVVKAIEAIS